MHLYQNRDEDVWSKTDKMVKNAEVWNISSRHCVSTDASICNDVEVGYGEVGGASSEADYALTWDGVEVTGSEGEILC